MERLVTSNLKLGIIAGGQLGKMLIQEASKWDVISFVMDNEKECPAASVASHYIKGDRLNYDDVYRFGKMVDVLTYEIESINTKALKKLKEEGVMVKPDPEVLELIQDKGLQKQFYEQHAIPTSPFKFFDGKEDILKAVSSRSLRLPFVQKIRKGGYDGQGVAIIETEKDLGKLLEGESIVEEKVPIAKEISVIAARNDKGEVRSFPVVEMVFDKQANLVERLTCPANISAEQEERAQSIAMKLINSLEMSGLLAVEFFIDEKGEVIVNEISPRPHNSGHHSFESVITSQFEQHLRGIMNLPLGSTKLKMPAVMINLLGEPGYEGNVKYEGLTDSMAVEGVKIHLYGKKITKPFRKMGHVTVLSESLEDAIAKAEKVKNLIKVKA